MTIPSNNPDSAVSTLKWEEIELMRRHGSIARRGTTLLLVVDVQERLIPSISRHQELIDRIRMLLDAAAILKLRVAYSEQYPKGLGATVPGLLERLEAADRIEKTSFSIVGSEEFINLIADVKPTHIALVGIEAHVCVAQSALDLTALGHRVTVIHDATSSRNLYDKDYAIERLRSEGVTITTSEAFLFELTEVAGTPEFKEILKLVK